jgi:hypothetical protein
MKKIISITLGALLLAATLNASAFWGNNGNNGWGGGNGYNDWPIFTPMYWMEEMSNEFDNNNFNGGPGYGYGNGYGMPFGGNGMPFGNGYGAPYGGGYGAPAPYGAPYGGGYGYAPAYPTAPAPAQMQ